MSTVKYNQNFCSSVVSVVHIKFLKEASAHLHVKMCSTSAAAYQFALDMAAQYEKKAEVQSGVAKQNEAQTELDAKIKEKEALKKSMKDDAEAAKKGNANNKSDGASKAN